MIRLIIRIDDAGMAAHVGGAVLTTFQTFDVDLPDVEAALNGGGRSESAFCHVQLVGAEVVAKATGVDHQEA